MNHFFILLLCSFFILEPLCASEQPFQKLQLNLRERQNATIEKIEAYKEIEKGLTEAWANYGKSSSHEGITCSPAYIKALQEADNLAHSIGGIGPIDYDSWIQGQDYDYVEMEILKIEVYDSKSAKADIIVNNTGSKTPVTLLLVRENGTWYIDDFINEWGSERKQIEDYINIDFILEAKAHAANQKAAYFDNAIDSLSYCYGVLFGDQYSNFQDRGVVVPDEIMNLDNFLEGFITAIRRDSTNLKVKVEDAQTYLRTFQQSMQETIQQKQEKELAANKAKGAGFMAQNAQKNGVVVTESGLQIQMLAEGTGARPSESDKVLVNYKGTLIDGTVFDANDSIEFPVNVVIAGLQEGLMAMKEGSKAIITMPSDLAYGDRGAGQNIPGGSTLQFEVVLRKVIK